MSPEALTGLFVLGGVVVGGSIGFFGQAWLQRTDRKHRARQIAGGLAGEVEGLVHIGGVHQYANVLRGFASTLESGTPPGGVIKVPVISVRLHYFDVYEANAGELGLLPPYLARQVAKFYVHAKSVLEDFAWLGESTSLQIDLADRIAKFRRVATLIDDTTNLGRDLVLQLDAFAADPPSRPPSPPWIYWPWPWRR